MVFQGSNFYSFVLLSTPDDYTWLLFVSLLNACFVQSVHGLFM
ncbi:hypothetical protein SynA1562_02309 [Synechococcus sp. A15-62]|nr:hypothetical protein SynA1562_02309 [Synechococcus sp. A15-62]